MRFAFAVSALRGMEGDIADAGSRFVNGLDIVDCALHRPSA